jgi:hypothetical protein
MLGNIIGGFIVILVGVTLAPTIATEVAGAQASENITGASSTILGLTTLFYNLSIASTAIGKRKSNAHSESNLFMHKPEYRLNSLRGQDRGVKHKNYAVETAKGFLITSSDGMIYSPTSDYKMKSEINKMIAAQGLTSRPLYEEIHIETGEYRLKSSRGQDRAVNQRYGVETDKPCFTFSFENESKIYSPTSDYKMKSEINKECEKFRFDVNRLRVT